LAKYDNSGSSHTPVIFNPFCSRTPRCNLSSTLYLLSCWCMIQVIHNP
jgi:hypothetical protein